MIRRASTSRRRLGTADSATDLGTDETTSAVVHKHLRSRSQERSVSVRSSIAPNLHGDDSHNSHASSTAGSENGDMLDEMDPLDSGECHSKSIVGGVISSKDGRVVITTGKPTNGKNIRKSAKYHRRAASDPFDISGLEDAQSTAPKQPVSEGPAISLPTLPRYPVAETRDLNCWSEPPIDIFKVRGKNYLKDKKKVNSEPFLLRARGCDLLLFPTEGSQEEPVDMLERSSSLLNGTLRKSPTLVLNFRFPWGLMLLHFEIPPKLVPFLQRVPKDQHYKTHTVDSSVLVPSLDSLAPGERTLAQWIMGDTNYKNQRLKLIPYVVQGPWVVRNLVTGKPAIIGTKLPVSYQVADNLLVAELDIGNSSAAAKRIVSLCRRYMNALTCDIGFVIQANTAEELPEQMLGAIRIHGVDPLKAPTFV